MTAVSPEFVIVIRTAIAPTDSLSPFVPPPHYAPHPSTRTIPRSSMASLASPFTTAAGHPASANPFALFGTTASHNSQKDAHNLYSELYRVFVAPSSPVVVPTPRKNGSNFNTLNSKRSMPSFLRKTTTTTQQHSGSVRVVLRDNGNVSNGNGEESSDEEDDVGGDISIDSLDSSMISPPAYSEFGVLPTHRSPLQTSPSSPSIPLSSPSTPASASKRFFGRVLGLKKAGHA